MTPAHRQYVCPPWSWRGCERYGPPAAPTRPGTMSGWPRAAVRPGRRGGVSPRPARGLAGQPAQCAGRVLFQQGSQGEAPFADPVASTRRLRAGGQAAAGEDETTADRGDEQVQQGVQVVGDGPGSGAARRASGSHPPGWASRSASSARLARRRPGRQAGSPQISDGVQVAGQPGPGAPEQHVAGRGQRVGGRGGADIAGRLAERCVQAEQPPPGGPAPRAARGRWPARTRRPGRPHRRRGRPRRPGTPMRRAGS